MLLIKNNTIYLTRGDKAIIPLVIPINEEKTEFYQFQIGDVVTFAVYEEDGYDKCAQILKEITIDEVVETCNIELTSEETKIGELINEPVNYWYEIVLNNEETVLGFEAETLTPQIFVLLPEGSDNKC